MEYRKTHPEIGKTPKYIYSNEANLHAKLATGKSATKWKSDLKLKEHESFYSYLSNEQFKSLVFLNQATLGLILAEKTYAERKEIFKTAVKKLFCVQKTLLEAKV
jgi:hypothetical protein